MVKEADAGRDRRCPSPVEIDCNLDIRFVGLALDRCGANACLKSVSSEKRAARSPGLDFTIAAMPPQMRAFYQAPQASATAGNTGSGPARLLQMRPSRFSPHAAIQPRRLGTAPRS